MKFAVAGIAVFLAVFLYPGGISADLLSCNVFVDGFFEIDIRFEKTGEDGSKQELARENKVGKDSLIFEADSGEGNGVVFVVKPKESSMVVFSVRNVEKGTQYFFTGVVNDMGELFAFAW
jgi:hypothetical protein